MTHRESPENLPGVPPKKASRTAHQSAWGQGRLRPQVDGTAGLPSAPEMACAPRELRLVPKADLVHRTPWPGNLSVTGYGVPWRPSLRPRANRDWLGLHEAPSSGRRV